MAGSTVFDDPQAPGRDLPFRAVVEEDDAVGDVFLQPVPGEGFLPLLAGDDGGDSPVLQPAEKAAQLGAQDVLVVEAVEESLDGVQHDPAGTDGINGRAEPDEQTFQVVLPRLLDLGPLDVQIIYNQLPLLLQIRQIEPEGSKILAQFLRSLLERNKDARVTVVCCPTDQEFHGKQGLAASGPAADKRGTSQRDASAGNLIKSLYAGGTFP